MGCKHASRATVRSFLVAARCPAQINYTEGLRDRQRITSHTLQKQKIRFTVRKPKLPHNFFFVMFLNNSSENALTKDIVESALEFEPLIVL